MWSSEVTNMIITGIWETLYMTLVSTLVGYVIGLPMGIILTVSDKDGIKPNAVLYKILDVIANIVRSVPFIILLVLLIPFTRLVVGSRCRCDRGSKIYGSIQFYNYYKSNVSGGKNIPFSGSNYYIGNNLRLFRNVRSSWRRRSWCYRDPLWIHQMADRYYDRHSYIVDYLIPDIPDSWNETGR